MDASISRPLWRTTLRNYVDLTKPTIVILLVFTCLTAMFVAARGVPDLSTLLITCLAGMLSAGGAGAINQYLDREMDGQMKRTAWRPIPSGRVTPLNALLFGLALIAWSILLLGVMVNWLSAVLVLIGAIYYVFLYTIILKRNTVVNIVIGGGAGAMPVLVGWAAVTNALSVEAFILFAIIFYWTPPHSWALALLVNDDYAAVGVPMMPVAKGTEVTYRQILYYSLQLVLITLLPGLLLLLPDVPDMLGWIYLFAAALLGVGIIRYAVALMRKGTQEAARVMWKFSSRYLAMLFLVMIIDRILLG